MDSLSNVANILYINYTKGMRFSNGLRDNLMPLE